MSVELHPGQTFAGYRIEAIAGRGAMGIVYRATELDRDRTVALKLIAPDVAAEETFRRRLQRESELLASIDHPNVIAFYEAGEADGQLFISMRFVEGQDLRWLIAEQGRLAPEHAARIVAQVAAGLDAAHANGLVHRDVKPANVLIERRDDGSSRAYLSDFGLTKDVSLTAAVTRSGWVGTLDYVAPEQIENRRVDARADVYALGGVLFQTLTGRVAYVRESDPAKLWAHLHDAVPSACELRRELPAELDRVIARAMAKDPAQRYPSAGDLGRAAIAAAGGEALTEPGRSVAEGEAAPAATDDPGQRGGVSAGPPAGGGGASAAGSRRLRRPTAVAGACAALLVLGAVLASAAFIDRGPGRQPRVERISLGGLAVASKIVADADAAHVLDGFAGTVFRLRAVSGQIEGRVKLSGSPADIAVDPFDRRVWVVNQDETISELDPRRGRLAGRPFRVDPSPSSVVALDDELVVLSRRSAGISGRTSLLRVDKRTHRRLGDPVQLDDSIGNELIRAGTGVAVVAAAPAAITTYGPRLERLRRLSLASYQERGVADEVAVEGRGTVAWVVFSVVSPSGGPRPLRSVVLRVDTATGNQIGGPIAVGRDSHHIAIDQGVVWVPSAENESVIRIGARSGRAIGKPIAIGPNNGEIAVGAGVAWVGGKRNDVIKITPR